MHQTTTVFVDLIAGLFEWSMKYQDGTVPTSESHPMSEADRSWLENALKGAMVDLSNRMLEIKGTLDSTTTSTSISEDDLHEKEQLLEELMEIVESIDQAKDLSTIGGMNTLLSLLESPFPTLQWRAAEVTAICVQNNPPVQQAFMNKGIMLALWPLLDHTNITVQIKSMLAISCMIRGYQVALDWIVDRHGIEKIISLLACQPNNTNSTSPSSGDTPGTSPTNDRNNNEDEQQRNTYKLQRKCLQVLDYIFHHVGTTERNAACTALLPFLTNILAHCGDPDVRSAALSVSKQLTSDGGCLRVMQRSMPFVEAIEAIQCRLDVLPREDWGCAEEEVELSKSLLACLHVQVPGHDDIASSPGSDARRGSERTSSMQLIIHSLDAT